MQSLLYNILLRANPPRRPNAFYQWLWNKVSAPGHSVTTRLHGSKVKIPADYIYPLICRNVDTFNNPYLELVHQSFLLKQERLTILDAGAAIGDTFLFIQKNIPEAVNKIYCVEGNTTFLTYLKRNLAPFDTAIIIDAVLSSEDGFIRSLVPIHNGTASAQGEQKIYAYMLDSVWEKEHYLAVDVLKVDVEGFDGDVLAGAAKILRQYQPAVIFEFHPLLIRATDNDMLRAFRVLRESGYNLLLWYNKFGLYSHSLLVSAEHKILYYANKCINGEEGDDWHYHIIALDTTHHTFDVAALTNCDFAASKSFPC